MPVRYGQLFENPGLHATITNRIVLGDFIVDYENIRGMAEFDLLKANTIYQLRDGVIGKVWFIPGA
jgi:hypothetical protein